MHGSEKQPRKDSPPLPLRPVATAHSAVFYPLSASADSRWPAQSYPPRGHWAACALYRRQAQWQTFTLGTDKAFWYFSRSLTKSELTNCQKADRKEASRE